MSETYVFTVARMKTSSGILLHAVLQKLTDVSDVLTASIKKAMSDIVASTVLGVWPWWQSPTCGPTNE
jgi:hypothetical protein